MENGFTSGLISVGGNVRAISGKDEIGNKNSSDIVEPWNVAVQNPDLASEQAQLHVMNLVDASLVTSGVYERFYIVDNKRYHHIIDTRTLYPSEYYSSVTIICRDSGMADALSTAVFNMPFEQGIEFVNGLDGVEALWVQNDGDVKYSDGFRALIME